MKASFSKPLAFLEYQLRHALPLNPVELHEVPLKHNLARAPFSTNPYSPSPYGMRCQGGHPGGSAMSLARGFSLCELPRKEDMRRSLHACIYASRRASMHPCIHASVHPCHPCIHPCFHASMHPCIHASMHPCIHASMHPTLSNFGVPKFG